MHPLFLLTLCFPSVLVGRLARGFVFPQRPRSFGPLLNGGSNSGDEQFFNAIEGSLQRFDPKVNMLQKFGAALVGKTVQRVDVRHYNCMSEYPDEADGPVAIRCTDDTVITINW